LIELQQTGYVIAVGMGNKHMFYLPALLQQAGHEAIACIEQQAEFFNKIPGRK
jgi:hypothetical protein